MFLRFWCPVPLVQDFTFLCKGVFRCVHAKCYLCLKGSVRLVSVSCGSQNVWAVDSRGVVYFRVGTQPLNPSMMLPAWIHIEPPVQVTRTLDPYRTSCTGNTYTRATQNHLYM